MFPVSEVMAAARGGQPAVVAVVGEELVGMAVAQAEGERAWVLLVALAAGWRHRGIGSALLVEFLVRESQMGRPDLGNRGAAAAAPSAPTPGFDLWSGLEWPHFQEAMGMMGCL